ncbi:shikimate dehydrogenase [Acuticoccus sp. M5D2P5]|uniref:shikimate dehydrogenase n=1 Tax=Acuticoccus kalidii TaxID=2910977 RepID=UPI001F44A2BA|nr:shikimate dehydrogenase [Acuticoccus kalidii]MCF3933977.1 shikimate dehydrogenase [Acuticoccus kalidii]
MSAPKRVGVVGYPVKHSRSPMIFEHWFGRYGIDARYDRIEVKPEDGEAFFATLADSDLAGVNVTMPHKAVAARHAKLDDAGRRLGAINTLWRDGAAMAGTSSDGSGFLKSLDAQAPAWRGRGAALVLGAGGAAVSVADALAAEGVAVRIANRTEAKAKELADLVDGEVVAWDRLPDALAETALLVNATSLGMTGSGPLDIDLSPLPAQATVADLVYYPLETPLLRDARARGFAAVDGLGMLLYQATVGFERWFGMEPAVDDELRRVLLATF